MGHCNVENLRPDGEPFSVYFILSFSHYLARYVLTYDITIIRQIPLRHSPNETDFIFVALMEYLVGSEDTVGRSSKIACIIKDEFNFALQTHFDSCERSLLWKTSSTIATSSRAISLRRSWTPWCVTAAVTTFSIRPSSNSLSSSKWFVHIFTPSFTVANCMIFSKIWVWPFFQNSFLNELFPGPFSLFSSFQ